MIEAKAVPYEKRMTLGKVISFTVAKVFKEITAVGQWILLMLLMVLINLIPMALIVISIMGSFSYLPALGATSNPFESANLALMIPGAVLMLLAIIADIGFGIFTLAWFNRLGLDAFEGQKRAFGERFKLGMKETYRLVGPVLLLGIFGLLAMIPNYIVSAMDIGSGISGDMAPFTSPLATLFYFVGLCVSYFITIKTIAAYGLLLENPEMQVMECFKASFAMTKGRGWRILGYFICLLIIIILVCLALAIPGLLVWLVVLATDFSVGVTVIAVVVSIVLYMLMIAFGSGVQGMFTAGVYKHLMIEHTEEVTEVADGHSAFETIEREDEKEQE